MTEIEYLNSEPIKEGINKLSNNIRTERSDLENYLSLYADKSIISRLDNNNNQVIFGRRGTGKTHLLYAFEDSIQKKASEKGEISSFPIYIDLRKFLPLFTANSNPNVETSIIIFQSLLNEIVNKILDHSKYIFGTNEYGTYSKLELERIEKLKNILKKINVEFDGKVFKKLGDFEFSVEEQNNLKKSLNVSTEDASLGINKENGSKVSYSQDNIQYISFNEISKILDDLTYHINGVRILCLLDEWSEIPINLQPYLAELLKRTFIASNYTFKIAAIPYRTRLRSTTYGNIKIGLEEGGDIFPINIDNRYIYEKDKNTTRNFYNELLRNHLIQIDKEVFEEIDENKFINIFFATQALSEILIASAGIPRDFINLFILSYNNRINKKQRIILKNVRNATTEWYSSDKKEEIDKDPLTKRFFEDLVNQIVIEKNKTHFLLPQRFSDNLQIKKLVDLRALHLREKGISHRHIQSKNYDVYSIDYGSYTSLDITKNTLDTDFNEMINQVKTIENIRDARSLSIEDEFFDKFNLAVGQGIKCPTCSKTIDTNHLAYIKQKICNNCFEKVE
jgi:hypothetical protein